MNGDPRTNARRREAQARFIAKSLLIIAATCFGLAAIGVPSKINLLALGLLAWVLSVLIPAIT